MNEFIYTHQCTHKQVHTENEKERESYTLEDQGHH